MSLQQGRNLWSIRFQFIKNLTEGVWVGEKQPTAAGEIFRPGEETSVLVVEKIYHPINYMKSEGRDRMELAFSKVQNFLFKIGVGLDLIILRNDGKIVWTESPLLLWHTCTVVSHWSKWEGREWCRTVKYSRKNGKAFSSHLQEWRELILFAEYFVIVTERKIELDRLEDAIKNPMSPLHLVKPKQNEKSISFHWRGVIFDQCIS